MEENSPVDCFRRRVPDRCDSAGGNLLQRQKKASTLSELFSMKFALRRVK